MWGEEDGVTRFKSDTDTQEAKRTNAREWNRAHRDHCHKKNHTYHKINKDAIAKRKANKRAENKEHVDAPAKRAGYRKWREAEVYTPPFNGPCNCCGKEAKLVYDHDHLTKKFRGWLCINCNFGLGQFGDSAERLKAALNYLERSKCDNLAQEQLETMMPTSMTTKDS